MITVYWPGRCPKCGSHNIRSYTWANVCGDCGYVEWASKAKEDTTEKLEEAK